MAGRASMVKGKPGSGIKGRHVQGKHKRGQEALASRNREEADLAASYHALLASDTALVRETAGLLSERQLEGGITMPGRLLCHVLRPRLISAERSGELAHIAAVLSEVFERAGQRLLASDALLDLINASEEERSLWLTDPGFPRFTVTSRLDSFMVGNRPRFVEYNAESPASIGYCDILTQIFLETPAMQRWEKGARLRAFEARREILDTLLWAYHEWGGTGTPTIAIVDWDDVMTKRDFELCGEYFTEHGVPTVITDPRAFDYHGGKLWLGDQVIPLVYRRVLLHELLDKADEAHPLLQAYRDGAVCIVNSPRSKILHKKATMALVDDGSLDLHLSDEEQRVIDATIPWTRLLREGKTMYDGKQVDLIQFVLAEKDRLALKPSDDYGGHGVVLGWEASSEQWKRSVESSLDQDYVVQERVQVPEAEFPIVDQDELRIISFLVDTNPLLFRGQMGGILTRISGSALLNVTAGTGSTVPTFVVDEED